VTEIAARRLIQIRLPQQVAQEQLLKAMAQALDFPDWFGHNWDALWDSLDEHLAESEVPLELVLYLGATRELNETDWQIFLDILQQAKDSWPGFMVRVVDGATT
jgi:RNAse (barnase) inhibitor barstar